MNPCDLTYDICRCYLNDQRDVEPALVSKIRGFHRSRNLAGLTSCSRYFDEALHTVNEWRFLRQVEAFFKKNSAFSNDEMCAAAARKSFMDSEASCSATNRRLQTFIKHPGLLDQSLTKKISRMERYICNVLGDFTRFLDDLPNLVRVTPGATASSSRRNSLPQMKLRMRLYSTNRAAKYLDALYRFHGFRSPRIKPTTSNRVELVPKNWKTARTIACEPEGNLPLQLAFDKYAKRRLRHFGIKLHDQSRNQLLAKRASVDNSLATVDFSAASDTISFNVISWLFPVDWFSFLWDVRSPGYRGVFGDGVYSKFSSMGNGATFTIETLVFAAACYAVGSKNFSVYGDDVILESELFDEYHELTRFLGFTINTEKTFTDGPFRESCGLDCFNGIDVTPTYIRGIDKRKASLCHLVNTVGSLTYPDSDLQRLLVSLVEKFKLPLVPFQESTLSGVWIDPDKARTLGILKREPLTSRYAGCDRYRAYTAKYKKRYFVDSRGYYLWFLYKNSQVLFGGPWEISSLRTDSCNETSEAPVFQHAYVRKRVFWHLPKEATPVHLQWCTESYTRALLGAR